MFDPKEFKDYMATLLDNDKWVHFDSELRKQEKYCFFGNEISATNKPKISIRIDDYSRQFYQKLKWFWKTTENSTSKNCFPGWDDMGAECFYFPKENLNGQGLDYWNAVTVTFLKFFYLQSLTNKSLKKAKKRVGIMDIFVVFSTFDNLNDT